MLLSAGRQNMKLRHSAGFFRLALTFKHYNVGAQLIYNLIISDNRNILLSVSMHSQQTGPERTWPLLD